MNLEYKNLIAVDFAPDSRIWIYQANRLFSLAEALEIEILLKEFAANWKSHGLPVKGIAYLFFPKPFISITLLQRNRSWKKIGSLR